MKIGSLRENKKLNHSLIRKYSKPLVLSCKHLNFILEMELERALRKITLKESLTEYLRLLILN